MQDEKGLLAYYTKKEKRTAVARQKVLRNLFDEINAMPKS
jgi:hypothetical protein